MSIDLLPAVVTNAKGHRYDEISAKLILRDFAFGTTAE
jgi:hypothetical protein